MKIVFVFLAVLLCGCSHSRDFQYGMMVSDMIKEEDSCVLQATIYKNLIGGTVMCNEEHAFVVKDGYIYDSTNMECTEMSVDSVYIRQIYGTEWEEL